VDAVAYAHIHRAVTAGCAVYDLERCLSANPLRVDELLTGAPLQLAECCFEQRADR
jgi:hypothetical protein